MTLETFYVFKRKVLLLSSKRIFKAPLTVSYVLRLLIHDRWFWSNINLDKLQITVLKRWRDVSKTISCFQMHIQGYRPNIFSSFFWLVYRFCGLWYTLPLCFMEYWTEVMTDIVLNRQRNVIQSFSWCCVSTVPRVSLVISEI